MKCHKPGKKSLILIIKIIFLIGAALLIINSIMAILLVPINLGSFLPGIAGLAIIGFIAFNKQIRSFLNTRAGRVTGWIFGCIFGVNAILFLFFLAMTLIQSADRNNFKPDAVIVLGAGLRGDRVTITLAARLDTAVSYYIDNPGVPIVVSGGQGSNETVPEAGAMANYLVSRGVPEDKIIREARSSNTEENFAFSKAILTGMFPGKPLNVLYVTNSFHIYRAGLYAKKAGLTAYGLAAPTLPRYLILNNFSREYFALIKYWLFRR